MNNARGIRWLIGTVGAVMLLFGVLCLNYTKMGSAERHREVALRHGWPEPSRGIVYLGMLFAPIGGGLIGFALGRRRSAPTQTGHSPADRKMHSGILAIGVVLWWPNNSAAHAQAPAPSAHVVQAERSATSTSNRQSNVQKQLNKDGSLHRITGRAKVLDAHTLVFDDGTEVDLNGVMDAPELEQWAALGDSFYACGKEAAAFLQKLIDNQTVTFLSFGGKRGRPRGNCYAGEIYVQEAMVRNGWAVSDHSGTELAQRIAQEHKRGLWRGPFVPPKRWRKGERLPGE